MPQECQPLTLGEIQASSINLLNHFAQEVGANPSQVVKSRMFSAMHAATSTTRNCAPCLHLKSQIDGIFVGLSQTISMIEWGWGSYQNLASGFQLRGDWFWAQSSGKQTIPQTGQALGHAMRKSLGFFQARKCALPATVTKERVGAALPSLTLSCLGFFFFGEGIFGPLFCSFDSVYAVQVGVHF